MSSSDDKKEKVILPYPGFLGVDLIAGPFIVLSVVSVDNPEEYEQKKITKDTTLLLRCMEVNTTTGNGYGTKRIEPLTKCLAKIVDLEYLK